MREWAELRLRRVPLGGRRGLPEGAGPAEGRGHEDADLGGADFRFRCVLGTTLGTEKRSEVRGQRVRDRQGEGHAYPFMQEEGAPAALGSEGLLPEATGLGMRLLELCSLRLHPGPWETGASSSSPEEKEDVPESTLLLIQRLCCFCTRTRARSGGLVCRWSPARAPKADDSSGRRTGIRLRLLDGSRPSALLGWMAEEFWLLS